MSQPLDSPQFGTPPPKSGGGMSTVMIVLIIGGLVLLLCCGACGGCFYFGLGQTNQVRDDVMRKVGANQAVKDALGEPLTPSSLPTNVQIQNQNVTIDFDVTGPKGTGKVHAEGVNGVNGFEPSVIHVTPSGGQMIDVNAASDPTDMQFDMPTDDSEE